MKSLLDTTCEFLRQYGYLASDAEPRSFKDVTLTSAIAKYQRFDANVQNLKEATGEALLPDGKIGPATAYAMAMPRCSCPDNEVGAALGTGGWKGCHGLNDGHKMIVRINHSRMPDFLKPYWVEIHRRKQRAWAEIGLLVIYTDEDGKDIITGERVTGTVNSEHSFERGSGWIGLAIVGNGSNQRCSSKIWAKFDIRYQPRDILSEWTILGLHEEGHNAGLEHTRGRIMNPSIVNGLKPTWKGDPSESLLSRWFGGEPVDVPDGEPPEPDPPDGDTPRIGEPIGPAWELYTGIKVQTFRVFGG